MKFENNLLQKNISSLQVIKYRVYQDFATMNSPTPNSEKDDNDVSITSITPDKTTTLIDNIIYPMTQNSKLQRKPIMKKCKTRKRFIMERQTLKTVTSLNKTTECTLKECSIMGQPLLSKTRNILLQSRSNYSRIKKSIRLMYLTKTKILSSK